MTLYHVAAWFEDHDEKKTHRFDVIVLAESEDAAKERVVRNHPLFSLDSMFVEEVIFSQHRPYWNICHTIR